MHDSEVTKDGNERPSYVIRMHDLAARKPFVNTTRRSNRPLPLELSTSLELEVAAGGSCVGELFPCRHIATRRKKRSRVLTPYTRVVLQSHSRPR